MRLELDKRTDYAVRAMLTLTRHPGETLSSADISTETGIPVLFVTQVMSYLVKARLARGVIGRSGGYLINAPADKVSILAIVEAVEGDTRRTHCALRGGPCKRAAPCEIHDVFADAQDAFIARLEASTLADVARGRRDARSGADAGSVAPRSEVASLSSPVMDHKAVAIRRVRPHDDGKLVEFYAGLSDESRYSRFMGFTSGPGAQAARTFCTPDHTHDEGFVAVAGEGAAQSVVGHLCLERVGDKRLELAVAVSDAYQGMGIGRDLVAAAVEWARSHHFDAIIASAFVDNTRVLRLLSVAPYPVHVTPADGGVVDVVMPLVPELLPDRPVVVPVALRASRRRSGRRPVGPSRCSRVVWRGTRRPARVAGDSASKGSS